MAGTERTSPEDDVAAGRRPRGRPKKTVSDASGPGLSLENPTDSLPATARSILAAARTVLAERGLEGLTIEAVANEANVSRTLIPYHFGSRAGLVEILIDSLFHDFAVDIRHRQAGAASPGCLEDFLEMVRLEAIDVPGQRDFFELMVCCLREEQLRQRMAALFTVYREVNLTLTGVAGSDDPNRRRQLAAVGAVLQAITDGLALQAAMDPEFDLEGAIAAVEELMGTTVAELMGTTVAELGA
jgi:AcrR family transcriptional regulator